MYVDTDSNSCLLMHTVFGLLNSDDVQYTDEERFVMLGMLPEIRRQLEVL